MRVERSGFKSRTMFPAVPAADHHMLRSLEPILWLRPTAGGHSSPINFLTPSPWNLFGISHCVYTFDCVFKPVHDLCNEYTLFYVLTLLVHKLSSFTIISLAAHFIHARLAVINEKNCCISSHLHTFQYTQTHTCSIHNKHTVIQAT